MVTVNCYDRGAGFLKNGEMRKKRERKREVNGGSWL